MGEVEVEVEVEIPSIVNKALPNTQADMGEVEVEVEVEIPSIVNKALPNIQAEMGEVEVEVEVEIPSIVLCDEVLGLGKESEEAWKALSNKVTEACKTHGCLLVDYSEKISVQLQEELFSALEALFDLPQETKDEFFKNSRPGAYVGNKSALPLYESIGIFGQQPQDLENQFQAFADLIGPDGNLGFCEVINSVNSKLLELTLILLRMIFEGLGIGKNNELQAEHVTGSLRATKYKIPPVGSDPTLGLYPHIDKTILSIIFQSTAVHGIEVQSKEGNWIQVVVPKGYLVVFVGDAFQVLSNGRVEGVKHRVMMKGDKERYSYGIFAAPKDGVTIEVPEELVDEEHPRLYKPVIYSDYVAAHTANPNFDALKIYAGI